VTTLRSRSCDGEAVACGDNSVAYSCRVDNGISARCLSVAGLLAKAGLMQV
jgi:hypothetical protein